MSIFRNTFPDENIPNSEKEKMEFAQKYALAIWQKEQTKLSTNALQFKKNQLYADGKHSLEECKNNLMKRKWFQTAYLSVDWDSRVTLLGDHLPKIWNGVDMTEFYPSVYATDPESRAVKSQRKEDKLKKLYAKQEILEIAQLNGGQSTIPLETIPESKEQVEIEEDLAAPLENETAEEMVIHGVAAENGFPNIQSRTFRDSVIDGLAACKIWTDPTEGIKMKYVPNDTFIHSHTVDPYFNDCRYFGHIEHLTVDEVRKIAKRNDVALGDDDIKRILLITDAVDDQAVIKVLHFAFKTHLKDVYKIKKKRENNRVSVNNRTSDEGTDNEYRPKYESDISQRVEDVYDNWFEGTMIIGGDNKVIAYNRFQNHAEYKGMILSPYIAYAPRISENGYNGLVEKAIPMVNQLQEVDWKLQHLRNQLKGKMVEIDPASLTKIPKGGGKFYEPNEVFEFFFTLGVTYRITRDIDNDFAGNDIPIREIPSTPNHDIVTLANEYLRLKGSLLEMFGYLGADQARADDKTLFDSEPYRLSENLALKDFSDGMFIFTTRCFQTISSMMDNIFLYSNLKDKYTEMIGVDDMDVIERYRKNRSRYTYENLIELRMTRQERMALAQNMKYEQEQGLLSSADIQEISNVRTAKLAYRMIKLRTEANRKRIQEYEMNKAQAAPNGNILAIQESGKNKLMLMQAETELKRQLAQEDHVRKLELRYFELQQEAAKLEDKKMFTKEMEELRQTIQTNRDMMKKEKDMEIALEKQKFSNANQSMMIDQRQGKRGLIPVAEEMYGSQTTEEVDLSQELNLI